MLEVLQVLALVLISVGVSLSLAHALELPGKLRLTKEAYLGVQTIYYPGFTIGGFFGEFGAMVATLAFLIFTSPGSVAFWLTLAALLTLLVMHGIYWVLIHPVNKVWLKDQKLAGAGAAFFAIRVTDKPEPSADQDWTVLRDRWEYSHVARAVLAMLSLIAVATAVVV